MDKDALIIFARAPIPGKVKTRLIPDIGRREATAIYISLLNGTLETSVKSGFSNIQLWIDGDMRHPFFKTLPHRHAFGFYSQSGEDLGQRMYHAFESALGRYARVILIGSDCPTLSVADLHEARHLLKNNHIVLGPTDDGGYYLIGLREKNRQLFGQIMWGRETVFKETCERARSLNWQLGLLPRRRDVDDYADLQAYFKLRDRG